MLSRTRPHVHAYTRAYMYTGWSDPTKHALHQEVRVTNLQLSDEDKKDAHSITLLSGRIIWKQKNKATAQNMITVRDFIVPHRMIYWRNGDRVDIHANNQVIGGNKKGSLTLDLGGMVCVCVCFVSVYLEYVSGLVHVRIRCTL